MANPGDPLSHRRSRVPTRSETDQANDEDRTAVNHFLYPAGFSGLVEAPIITVKPASTPILVNRLVVRIFGAITPRYNLMKGQISRDEFHLREI